MPLKLKGLEIQDTILIGDMSVGQVAIVRKWKTWDNPSVGDILYRGANDKWFNLTVGTCWTPSPKSERRDSENLLVKVLPPGQALEVTR